MNLDIRVPGINYRIDISLQVWKEPILLSEVSGKTIYRVRSGMSKLKNTVVTVRTTFLLPIQYIYVFSMIVTLKRLNPCVGLTGWCLYVKGIVFALNMK